MCIIKKCVIPWLPCFFGKDAKGVFVVTSPLFPMPGWPTKMPKGVASKRLRNCIPPRRSLVGAFCSDSHGWVEERLVGVMGKHNSVGETSQFIEAICFVFL